jgi:hypothetical protein
LDDTDAQRQPDWPELEELARPAREHRRLSPERRSAIIISLCRRAPLSVKDLSVLLDRSEAYIGDAIRPLVNAGELTFLYPDQPRHPRQKYLAASEVSVDLTPIEEDLTIEVPQSYLAPAMRPERRREDPPYRPPAADRLPASPARDPESPAPAFPNPAVNLLYAVAVGVVLGITTPPLWWAIAIAAAVLLSVWHRAANSAQYRQFGDLDGLPNGGAFLLLKSLVTFAEIALLFLATRAIAGR